MYAAVSFDMKPKMIDYCLAEAREICADNRSLRTTHVAFLVRGNKVFYTGWNVLKTHPLIAKHPYHTGTPSMHAELSVVIRAGMQNLKDYEMIVVRYDRRGNLAISRPCAGCQSVLRQVNISRVAFSDKNNQISYL